MAAHFPKQMERQSQDYSSQNHRMLGVGENLQISSSPTVPPPVHVRAGSLIPDHSGTYPGMSWILLGRGN